MAKFFAFCFVAFVLFVLVVPFTGLHYEVGRGTHTGYVTAVEKEGLIFKTYNVYFKSSAESSQEDMYCTREDVAKNLESALKSKEQIVINYVSYFANGITLCGSGGDIITNVQ